MQSLEGIAVLNIPSMHGGSNIWGELKKPDNVSETKPHEVITDPEILKISPQGETFAGQTLIDDFLRSFGADAVTLSVSYTDITSQRV